MRTVLLISFPLVAFVSSCTGLQAPSAEKLDPVETERKMVGLEQKFDLWDLNGNGYLTRRELVNGLQTVDVPEATPERIDDVMDFYDLNKDGQLSLRETQIGHERGPHALIEKVE